MERFWARDGEVVVAVANHAAESYAMVRGLSWSCLAGRVQFRLITAFIDDQVGKPT